MEIYPHARPPVTRCRQEAKYCLALGSFISIRSISAYIYQDSKQLPLLTTSTLFSHSLRCIGAERTREAAFKAIYTWRHNSIKRSCFVKETGTDMIILAGTGSAFVLLPRSSPRRARPCEEKVWSEVRVQALLFRRCCANLPFVEAGRTLLKWLPL